MATERAAGTKAKPIAKAALHDAVARVPTPTPTEIRSARETVGLTQDQAAQLVLLGSGARWYEYESGRRPIDPARWELFLVITTPSTSPAQFASLLTAQQDSLREVKKKPGP